MPFDSHSQACAEFRITRQRELEILFSKHQLIPRIKQEFIEAQAVELLTQKQIPIEFGLDLLTQIVLYKRAHVPGLVGILKKHFQGEKRAATTMA